MYTILFHLCEILEQIYYERNQISGCLQQMWWKLIKEGQESTFGGDDIFCLNWSDNSIEDEMVGWHHWLDGHEFEQAPRDGDGQRNLVGCSPWGCKELGMT